MLGVFDTGISTLLSAAGSQGLINVGFQPWMLAVLISLILIIAVYVSKIYRLFPQWIAYLRAKFDSGEVRKVTGITELDKTIQAAGYVYDVKQDIFYSAMDAWQRNVGYCRLYDESAAVMGMIIDCEPIYFNYGGKKWMIEFWKGQYDLTAGCEIGVYTASGPDLSIPGLFQGTFYNCASDEDNLEMSLTLKKNGKTLFFRYGRHWWLTGFKLGEFAEPWELTMELSITFKDEIMRNAFIRGLEKAGYSDRDIIINMNTVSVQFDKPHTPQPLSRITETDSIIQKKNRLLCSKYQEITGGYDNFPDKVKAIQEQAPEIYKEIMNIGKPRQSFDFFKEIAKNLK